MQPTTRTPCNSKLNFSSSSPRSGSANRLDSCGGDSRWPTAVGPAVSQRGRRPSTYPNPQASPPSPRYLQTVLLALRRRSATYASHHFESLPSREACGPPNATVTAAPRRQTQPFDWQDAFLGHVASFTDDIELSQLERTRPEQQTCPAEQRCSCCTAPATCQLNSNRPAAQRDLTFWSIHKFDFPKKDFAGLTSLELRRRPNLPAPHLARHWGRYRDHQIPGTTASASFQSGFGLTIPAVR